jgi:hypothetical protein
VRRGVSEYACFLLFLLPVSFVLFLLLETFPVTGNFFGGGAICLVFPAIFRLCHDLPRSSGVMGAATCA